MGLARGCLAFRRAFLETRTSLMAARIHLRWRFQTCLGLVVNKGKCYRFRV